MKPAAPAAPPPAGAVFPQRLSIDRSASQPVFLQAYEALRQQIVCGAIAPSAFLPAEQACARALGINHITLRKAMARLEAEGLIRRRRGVGTIVQERERWAPTAKGWALGILTWGAGNSPNQMSEFLYQQAARQALPIHTICSADRPLASSLAQFGVQALVSLPSGPLDDITVLAKIGMPVVMLEVEASIPGLDCVVIDSLPGVSEAMGELLRLGHRDIAYVGAMLNVSTKSGQPAIFTPCQDSKYRLEGYRTSLARAGIQFQPERCAEIPFSLEPARVLVDAWISSRSLPTAILAFSDSIAVLLMQALEERGCRVPEQVSIIGFGSRSAEAVAGRLATVQVDWDEMARVAVQRIVDRLAHGAMGGARFAVGSTFKPGASITACAQNRHSA